MNSWITHKSPNQTESIHCKDNESENRSYHEAQDKMALLPNYYKWIAKKFRTHVSGRVIELGVGAGFVLEHYIDNVEEVTGVDFNPQLLDRLKENFPQTNVFSREFDLRGSWDKLIQGKADTVIALDVLEHFEDDAGFASKISSCLRTGGIAIIKVPAQPKLFSAMDRASGHFRRYDKRMLNTLFQSAGFETLRLSYMNTLGAISYRMKSSNSTNFSRSVSKTSLHLANATMPLIAAFDTLPIKGLSIIGMFKKQVEQG